MSKRIDHKRNNLYHSALRYFEKAFLLEKLNNGVGYFIFPVIALLFGYLMTSKLIIGMGLLVAIAGAPILLLCLFNTEAGFYINVVYSIFGFHLSRLALYHNIPFPVGVFSDILTIATFLSLFIRQQNMKETLNAFTSNNVVRFLLIIYAYFALQLFNPNAKSFIGWYNAFRKVFATLLFFFTAYNVITSYDAVKKFIKVMFVILSLAAIYGCIQEWHGLFDFERSWLTSDQHRLGLSFIGGDVRKFGTMSDPAAYSVDMALCSVFFIVMAAGKFKRRIILTFLTGVIFMILAMSYSGTRTANAMLVAGIFFFILFTFDKKRSRNFAIISTIVFLAALFGTFNNSTINRFRTTFHASEDASYNVRENNRKSIQFYIYSHPIGGGLATTGFAGMIYNPGHFLAGFQPDSGYLRKALEIGPIGLILYTTLYFLILRAGISGYFNSEDENIKTIYVAATCALFCLFVGEYAQKAIGQITDQVIYYPLIVIWIRLNKFDIKPKTLYG